MSDERFAKWWPCLRKHYKRIHLWLPQAVNLQNSLAGERPFRYFTLCSREMIDVYMLVKEQILAFDTETRRVQGVSFCEYNQEIFPEMTELIGVEEAGFLAKLEDLVLFQDVPQTQTLSSDDALTAFLEESGEGLETALREKVEEKRRHLSFQRLFPFDFFNLDFCDRYYGDPPDVMKIHTTIDKLLEWQRQPGMMTSGQEFSVTRFVVTITCRVDLRTPADAIRRLKEMVSNNRAENDEYKEALQARSIGNLDSWASEAPLDFFMSAWPKEIARLAKQKSWNITIHDHAYYDRQSDRGENYDMVCLVVEFAQTNICNTYLSAVRQCLDENARMQIPRFEPTQGDGTSLLTNLRDIVNLRNTQASSFARDQLPDPLAEIIRLRALGIPI
jgi:hypothetical protein